MCEELLAYHDFKICVVKTSNILRYRDKVELLKK
jgi:hypothetical protein